jgi:hypothetical protein
MNTFRNNLASRFFCFFLIFLCLLTTLYCSNAGSGADGTGTTKSPAPVNPVMGGAAKNALTLSLNVAVFAGPAAGDTTSGDDDGTGTAARFNQGWDVTSDGTNLYLSDVSNNKIRKIVISTGVVTTLAGPAPGATTSGDADATGNAARFNSPRGMTTDGINLYVADTGNHKIRKIVISTGVVTTIAGPAAGTVVTGDTDGTGNAARFAYPAGITTDGTNLFVADTNNHKIRKVVISTGVVTTIGGPAQGTVTFNDTDATGNASRFKNPNSITTDGTNLYILDTNNYKIRKMVISTGVVTTIAGPAQGTTQAGDTDGTGNAARFFDGLGITNDGTNIYVSDLSNKIRKIVISSGVVTTIAGPAQGSQASGDVDANGNAARFSSQHGITTDGVSLFIADYGNNKIRKLN